MMCVPSPLGSGFDIHFRELWLAPVTRDIKDY